MPLCPGVNPPLGHLLIQPAIRTALERMIFGRQQHKNLSEIAASRIADASHILNAGEWVVQLVAYWQEARGSRSADERTRCLSFNDLTQLPPGLSGSASLAITMF